MANSRFGVVAVALALGLAACGAPAADSASRGSKHDTGSSSAMQKDTLFGERGMNLGSMFGDKEEGGGGGSGAAGFAGDGAEKSSSSSMMGQF